MDTNHNLNINDYSFNELLSLFNLTCDFTLNDLKECKKNNVKHLVRTSEPSYSKEEVLKAGISFHVNSFFYDLLPI